MDKNTARSKITKILAHAQSAGEIGSEEEAKSFMAVASRLIAKYQLEEIEISQKKENENEIINRKIKASEFGQKDTKRVCYWQVHMAKSIEEMTNVYSLFIFKSNKLHVFGLKSNIGVFIEYMKIATKMANELAREAYDRYLSEGGTKSNGYMRSWKIGFAEGLRAAIKEEQKGFKEETALVLSNQREAAKQKAQSHIDRVGKPQGKVHQEARNSGYERGKSSASFHKGIE